MMVRVAVKAHNHNPPSLTMTTGPRARRLVTVMVSVMVRVAVNKAAKPSTQGQVRVKDSLFLSMNYAQPGSSSWPSAWALM